MRLTTLLGIIAGFCCVAVLFPLFVPGKAEHKVHSCVANVRIQAMGLLVYAGDYDDRLPDGKHWVDHAYTYVKDGRFFHDPSVRELGFGYAFNRRLSKTIIPGNADNMEMVYDSVNLTRNAYDDVASIPPIGRHDGLNTIAFADGHAKQFRGVVSDEP